MIEKLLKRRTETAGNELDRSVNDWRANLPEEQLSPSTRQRILAQAMQAQPVSAPVFLPGRRLVLAAAVPVFVTALLALALITTGDAPVSPESSESATLTVTKSGDDVVFRIANGERAHRVYRSSEPMDLGDQPAFKTVRDGFRDRLDTGGSVVYYRID
ncbi:MAG: hypothetical protein GY716_24410 [bacterium]|nr:hypothetical protein [bacterium]